MKRAPARDRLLVAIVLLAALLRIALLVRPFAVLDDALLPDDAYLSLTIARNLARGLGPWYGTAPTNGFQPLYVLLCTPWFVLWPHDPVAPVRAALALLVACDLAAVVLLYRLVLCLGAGRSSARFAALLWAISPFAIATSLNGLETALAVALLAVAFLIHADRFVLRAPPLWRPHDALVLGLATGVAGFARVDALLAAPAMAVASAIALRRAGEFRRLPGLAGAALAGVAVPTLAWMLWFVRATGSAVPVSGRAVRYQALSNVGHAPTLSNLYLPMARRMAVTLLHGHAVSLATLVLLLGAIVACAGRAGLGEAWGRARPLGAMLGFAALLVVAYAGFVFAPWYFSRYLAPAALPLAILAALWLDVLRGRLPQARRRAATIAAIALAAMLSLAHPAARRLADPRPPHAGYARIGAWAARQFAPGTMVGGSQSGGLGYVADSLVVLNLDGVVNAAALAAMQRHDYAGYLRRTGVGWLIWQDDIAFIGRESSDLAPGELRRVATIPGVVTGNVPWSVWRFDPR